jgi:hypothetical protein
MIFLIWSEEKRQEPSLEDITPADKLAGLEDVIFAERDRKLETARAMRRQHQPARHSEPVSSTAREGEHRERLAGVQGAGNEATWSPVVARAIDRDNLTTPAAEGETAAPVRSQPQSDRTQQRFQLDPLTPGPRFPLGGLRTC